MLTTNSSNDEELDESTDIAGLLQLSPFIRYISNGKVLVEFPFCIGSTLYRGDDIFKIFDGFFNDNSLCWDKCAVICTDGEAACTGINSGAIKRVQVKTSNVHWTHCLLHRQALVAKSLSGDLHDTFNCVLKYVNYIKARTLNQHFFIFVQ